MNYGRIRRGPMAADAFTQIRNALFRDPRLSFRDKGVFGLISTHRDGFGVTPESIAAHATDGVSAVKVSLRNLEKYGYLRRTRVRNENGTLGASVYFITDCPELFDDEPEVENRRSEPTVENPPVVEPLMDRPTEVQPPVAGPTVANRSHKKTNSKKTKASEDSLSSPAPAVPPAGGSDRERETPAAPDNHTSGSSEPGSEPLTVPQRLVRAAGLLQPAEEQQFIAWVAATHKPRGAGWWRAVAASGDLPDLVAAWRTQHTPAATPTSSSLPPWCGDLDCSEIDRMREIERPDGHRVVTRCPACHPATAA